MNMMYHSVPDTCLKKMLLFYLIQAQLPQIRSYCRRRGSRVQLFFASALLHIVSSGNNTATVHFSQCDKQTASGEYFELLSSRNTRNNRQRWNVQHVSAYFSSYKCCMWLYGGWGSSESAEKNLQLVLQFTHRQIARRQKLPVMIYKTAMSNMLMRQLLSSGLATR